MVRLDERVKTVLNYRKPASWIVIGAFAVCIAVAICFLTNPKDKHTTLQTQLSSGDMQTAVPGKWDCTVFCAAESDTGYVITYSDQEIVSTQGLLTFQNRNVFDIQIHLLAPGETERILL